MASIVQYGPVTLTFVKTNSISRVAEWHELNYIGTRITASYRVVWSPFTQTDSRGIFPPPPGFLPPPGRPAVPPQRIALRPSIGSPFNPAAAPVNPAAFSINDVLSELMQPRLMLRWHVNGVPCLIAPTPPLVCDADGGPFPVSADVVGMLGPDLFLIDWVVSTLQNDTSLYSAKPNPILSSVWECEDHLNTQMLCTRTTRGQTKFHAGLLYTPGLYGAQTVIMDEMRKWCLPAVPDQFMRKDILVTGHRDGCTFDWITQDVEQNVSIGDNSGLITDVAASHTISVDNGAADEFGLQFQTLLLGTKTFTDIVSDLVKAATEGKGGVPGAFGNIPAWMELLVKTRPMVLDTLRGKDDSTNSIRSMRANALSRHSFVVEMKAKKLTNRAYIEQLIQKLIRTRLAPIITRNRPLLLDKSSSTYDLTNSIVHAEVVFLGPPVDSKDIYDPLPQSTLAKELRPEAGTDPNQIGTVAGQGTNPVLGFRAQSTAPTDQQTRGSAPSYILHMALSTPYNVTANLNGPTPRPTTFGNPPAVGGGAGVTAPNHPVVAPNVP